MSSPTLDYAALSTLNLWLMTDSSLHEMLNHGDRVEKLEALRRGSSRFSYAKELPSKFDEKHGHQRFEPVLNVIEQLSPEAVTQDVEACLHNAARKISSKYGNLQVYSATTKIMWLKFRSPVIIYEPTAADALGVKLTGEYFDRWKDRFRYYRQSVSDACLSLVDALQYVYDPETATREFVEELAAKAWFQQRVFGAYLSFIGRNVE